MIDSPDADFDIEKALAAYSAGEMPRTELEELTGLWFGEILFELAKRNLPLPRFSSVHTYTPEQKALYDKLFGSS
ncbi:MAG: hypothetical protein B7Y48_03985 [Methylophilales bacterium 28-44-11]|nr:MAG: hypothetical protein B7Y48_03985 [Methylophilales bacterium 28-44-11]